MKARRWWLSATLIIVAGLSIALFVNRAWLMDHIRLRGYNAPYEIQALATDTTMTAYAQRLFYVNHPALEDKTDFNRHCADHLDHSAVLGCYHGDRQGIYVYDVTDERLQGVEQVTAAHEMLHQAYDRLSAKEKARIGRLLTEYNNALTDETIKGKLALYEAADTVDLINEMHSIFGTEVGQLPGELEEYYRQYFANRQQVVALSARYQAAFSRFKDQVAAYDARLKTLGQSIDALKAQLGSDLAVIRSKERQLQMGPNGRDIAAYNREVAAYNALIDAYNAKVSDTRAAIDEYNKIVNERNAIAFAERQLQDALDSRLTPMTQ